VVDVLEDFVEEVLVVFVEIEDVEEDHEVFLSVVDADAGLKKLAELL
jgi:hypothetical protein